MAAWFPVLKAVLPYLGSIVAATVPAFTSRRGQAATDELVAQQISELQEAVTGNAETLKGLAAQLEQTITALAASEADLAQRLAALQDALARCESNAALAESQATRLEGEAAAARARADESERQLTGIRARVSVVAAIALLALVGIIFALFR